LPPENVQQLLDVFKSSSSSYQAYQVYQGESKKGYEKILCSNGSKKEWSRGSSKNVGGID
jgi:hypothetical protein